MNRRFKWEFRRDYLIDEVDDEDSESKEEDEDLESIEAVIIVMTEEEFRELFKPL
jgi:hypothetical protein